MSKRFLEYKLSDGTSVLIQAPDDLRPTGQAATRLSGESAIIQAEKTFSDAFEGVRKQAGEIRKKLDDLRADEVEVKFSLTATGELGNFAVGKIGVEANYEVVLKWKNRPEPPKKD